MTSPRILFVSNTGWYLYNFRLSLARQLRDRGADIVMVSPPDEYVTRLEEAGFRWVELRMERRSMNPLWEANAVAQLVRIFRAERANAIHNFTIKCVLYGAIAARICRVRAVVNALPGLGQVYTGRSWKARALRSVVDGLYRSLFRHPGCRVIFQNPDDLREFQNAHLIVPQHTYLIRSSGVNTDRFRPRPEADLAARGEAPIVFTAARLTHAKGIYELVTAARLLRERGVVARFQLAGDIDHGNPTAIPPKALDDWRREGVVEILGHVEGMEDFLAAATLVALPSYREGVPRTLTEAAAMGKPIVTTDAPGCREIVDHGVNGLRVPVRDAVALADAIECLLKDPDLCRRMGEASRQKAVSEFDERDVIRRTIEVYEDLGVLAPATPQRRPQMAERQAPAV
jgi:glycosyltransferase involved in cell wall biosynthesis